MSEYKVRVYDTDDNLITVFKPINPQYQNLFNEANERTFSIPATNENSKYLKLGRKIEIWEDENIRASGKIVERNTEENPWIITALSNEIYLSENMVPDNTYIDTSIGSSILGAGTTLKDIMEAITYDYQNDRINRDFQTNSEAYDSEISFLLEDSVNLKYEATGTTEELNGGELADVYLYPDIAAASTQGRVTLQFNIPDNYEIHRLRFQQEVAQTNNIIYRTRTSDGSTVSPWSSWENGDWSQDTPSTEGFPLTHPSGAAIFEVQFQLLNSDGGTTSEPTTRTEGYDENGNPIIIYGSTPTLEAVEVIFRQKATERKVVPHSTDWPSEATPDIYDTEFNYEKGLKISNNLCEEHSYEFYVDTDNKLHLQQEFSRDLVNTLIFKETNNMNILSAEDDMKDQINYLICLGNGDGLNQIKTVLKDDESIFDYGRKPDTVEFPEVTDINELTTKGQNYLDDNKNPIQRFRIQGVINDDFPDFQLGDKVRIVISSENINTTGRIIEENRGEDEDGINIRLGINDTIASIVDNMVDDGIYADREVENPNKPLGVTVEGQYRKIILKWLAKGDVNIYHSDTKDGEYKLLDTIGGRKFVHEPLSVASTHFYKLSQVRGGNESPLTQIYRATTSYISSSDIDDLATTLNTPQNLSLSTDIEQISQITTTSITADWDSVQDATFYQLRYRRTDISNNNWSYSFSPATIDKITSLVSNVQYEFQVRAASGSAASNWSSVETITTPKDNDAPSTPTITDYGSILKGFFIEMSEPSEDDWDGFEVHASTAGSGFTPSSSTLKDKGRNLRFEITDLQPLTTYYVKVISYDTSKNKSGAAY